VPLELSESWPKLSAPHQESAKLEVHERHARSCRRRLDLARESLVEPMIALEPQRS